jgi:tetratricopeptide (TPR) repeat protein
MRWREDAMLRGVESYLAWAAGQDALARGALDAAEREMRTAVAIGIAAFGPDDRRVPILRNGLAAVLKKRGKPDEAAVNWALSLQDTALSSIPDAVIADIGGIPVSLVDAAWELHDVGRDVEALAFVHRARRETASAPPSIFRDITLDDLEATIAISRGDLKLARELNARAVARLGPSPVLAHVIDFYTMRGDILAAEGDCAGAAKWYRYVIEQASHPTLLQSAKLGLARCHAALNELDDAAKLFDAELAAGIDIARERPRTKRLAADVHWRLGHRDRARTLAAEALRELGQLPALVGEHVALVRWLIARSA